MALPRLIFVTGKGGAGKSTVAAALALALSRSAPVTLADLDRRLCAVRLLAPVVNGAAGRGHPHDDLRTVALSARAELEAFVERLVPLRMVSRRMLKSRTFGYVTAALPGLEAFLMLDRLRMMAAESAAQRRHLVVDAPASGSALELLSVARAVRGMAPIGTLNRLALEIESFLTDRSRFGVIVTARPEEMALREATETVSMLRRQLGFRCVAAVLNATSRPLFNAAETKVLALLGAHAELAARRSALAADTIRARKVMGAMGIPVIELPLVFEAELGPVEIGRLGARLAAELLEQ